MRAAEQGPKQESIRDRNIHWNLRLLCKIQRAQKKINRLRKCYSFAAGGLKKNSAALRWLIRQNLRLSRKRVRWKAIFFGSEGMIGKGALEKRRVFPGTTSWRVLRQSKVGLVNSAATWKPRCLSRQDSKDLRDIARLPAHGYWSRIWTTNL